MARAIDDEPLPPLPARDDAAMAARAADFYERIRSRRSVRHFSSEPVPRAVIEDCIRAAGTAPNGANKQPWTFVAVSDPAIKRAIREAAEEEERAFYEGRASDEWLEALAPLGTDADKPFLEAAPTLIVVFQQVHGLGPEGEQIKHYYVGESVGIAVGFLIAALHHAGLATLTHTPSPMAFLREVLGRPPHERASMIVVVGHPAGGARVPRITKKPLNEIAVFREPAS